MNFGKKNATTSAAGTTTDSSTCDFHCPLCAELIPFRATDSLHHNDDEDDFVKFHFKTSIQSRRLSKEDASKTVERCIKRVRRLRYGLLKEGLLLQPTQKYTARDRSSARIIAPFLVDEIEVGLLLGSGGFSSVYEVTGFQPESGTSDSLKSCSPLERQSRSFMMDRVERPARVSHDMDPHIRAAVENAQVPAFAIKHLRRSLVKDPVQFERAALDLAMEAQLLLAMDHPNIVAMRGWAKNGVRGWLSGKADGFFIIMDRLPETLEDRIFQWRDSVQRYKSKIKKKSGMIASAAAMWGKKQMTKQKYSAKLEILLGQRLEALHDVTSGIEYMHSKRVLYRDLKSANVGFDLDGVLKLFDFGLSRLLPPLKPDEHEESFEMSRVGTVNYMAPEVDLRRPYNLSSDVYSLGVLGWEILSMSSPREALSSKGRRFAKAPATERCPLPICECWPQSVEGALTAGLSTEPRTRPSATQFRLALEEGMQSLTQFYQPAKRRGETIPTQMERKASFRVNLLTIPSQELANGGNGQQGSMTGASSGGDSTVTDHHSHVLGPNGRILRGQSFDESKMDESFIRSFYEEAKESTATVGSTVDDEDGGIDDTSSDDDESSSTDDNMDEDSQLEDDESDMGAGDEDVLEESTTQHLDFHKINIAGAEKEQKGLAAKALTAGQKRDTWHSTRSNNSEGRRHQDKRHHPMSVDED